MPLPHAIDGEAGAQRPAPDPRPPCGCCGAPIPVSIRGRPRTGARYCSPACRRAAWVERRAAARGELRAALLDAEAALARARAAAHVLGILPDHPRRPGSRRQGTL